MFLNTVPPMAGLAGEMFSRAMLNIPAYRPAGRDVTPRPPTVLSLCLILSNAFHAIHTQMLALVYKAMPASQQAWVVNRLTITFHVVYFLLTRNTTENGVH